MENEKKKQLPLRLSEPLYKELAAWAEDEFRSLNGQIEYLLSQAVKKHRPAGSKPGRTNHIEEE